MDCRTDRHSEVANLENTGMTTRQTKLKTLSATVRNLVTLIDPE